MQVKLSASKSRLRNDDSEIAAIDLGTKTV